MIKSFQSFTMSVVSICLKIIFTSGGKYWYGERTKNAVRKPKNVRAQ